MRAGRSEAVSRTPALGVDGFRSGSGTASHRFLRGITPVVSGFGEGNGKSLQDVRRLAFCLQNQGRYLVRSVTQGGKGGRSKVPLHPTRRASRGNPTEKWRAHVSVVFSKGLQTGPGGRALRSRGRCGRNGVKLKHDPCPCSRHMKEDRGAGRSSHEVSSVPLPGNGTGRHCRWVGFHGISSPRRLPLFRG